MNKSYRYKKYFNQAQLAKILGYSNLNSFASSSAHERLIKAIEQIVAAVEDRLV